MGDERIHLSKADVGEVEERYVLDALRSGWVAPLGPHVDAFEREIAERVGVDHALALSSGTAALHLALLGMGVGPGTAVIVPTMTFAASAFPVRYVGAEPVFVDCGDDGNVDPELLALAVKTLQQEGTPIAAIMTVDLFGRCADYDEILPIADEHGIPLLEDAAEALGATYRGKAAGSFGRAGVLSFNGNKIMTTSGGGMLLSDDGELVERARYLSTQARQPVPHYEHTEIGYNYRLSNILAALGRAQLTRLDEMIERRREIRASYEGSLGEAKETRFLGSGGSRGTAEDNAWLACLVIETDGGRSEASAEDLLQHLADAEVEARHLWKPMHLQPAFSGARAFLSGRAEGLFADGVALPSGAGLTDHDIGRVVSLMHAYLRDATGFGASRP